MTPKKSANWKRKYKSVISILLTGILQLGLTANYVTSSSIQNIKTDTSLEWALCSQMISHFEAPCLCTRVLLVNEILDHNVPAEDLSSDFTNTTYYYVFDCDHVSIAGSFPVIPLRLPAWGYSHRHGGFQTLDSQLFTSSDVPLRWVDFSHNYLHRLTNRIFEGVEDTLEEIRLAHNSLGQQLNPVFNTDEFKTLVKLRLLDLSHNKIKAMDDGLFRGMESLRELHLQDNYLNAIPTPSLQNIPDLEILLLQRNQIEKIDHDHLRNSESLKILNLSSNAIYIIENQAFSGLGNLSALDLSSNMLHTLTSKSFTGLNLLQDLDLSYNFLKEVPSLALRSLKSLTSLNLGSNGIQEIRLDDFAEMASLEYLDLSRNRIAELPPTAFSRLTNLQTFLMNVNLMRKVEEAAFEGMQNLRHLSIDDNTFLGIPMKALAALPNLDRLSIGYNRIAAISPDLLKSLRNLEELVLDFNLIREIPNLTFGNFTNLLYLSFRGNQIASVQEQMFHGIEATIKTLNLASNALERYPDFPYLPNLHSLDLSENNIRAVPEDILHVLPALKYLSLAQNLISEISEATFGSSVLEQLDLRANNLKSLPKNAISKIGESLATLDLSRNKLLELDEDTFANLPNLQHVNLAENRINAIHHNAFSSDTIRSLRTLDLSGNSLTILDGAIFQSALPKLRTLDLSENQLHYVIPGALSKLPGLQQLDLSSNKLNIMEGILQEATSLEKLMLQHNQLQQIDSGQFSHAIRLYYLDLSNNQIQTVYDGIFWNSSQVRYLNLSDNKLSSLPEGAFNGLTSLELNLAGNNFTSLPAELFSRKNIAKLLAVDFARNRFVRLPLNELNDQFSTLHSLIFAKNHISHVPTNTNVLVNVKRLDLSGNPLSDAAQQSIFGEPKTVQELDMANCGITDLSDLETPFIQKLNLSGNSLTHLNPDIFQSTTMLESLDISRNKFNNLQKDVAPIWSKTNSLKELDLSGNPIQEVGADDLNPLPLLKSLKLSSLEELGRFDHEAMKQLKNLKSLSISGYLRLGFYDVHGILESTTALESLEVEVKGKVLQDQLHPSFNPRLHNLIISGNTLENLTAVSFAGLLAPTLNIAIHGTSISSIPNTIFLPLPSSGSLHLDLANNQIAILGPQLLMTMNERRHHVQLKSLANNPLYCDCFMKSMLKWMRERIMVENDSHGLKQLVCSGPEPLKDQFIWTLKDEDMTCEKITGQPATTSRLTTPEAPTTKPAVITTPEYEPDIIFEAPTPRAGDINSEANIPSGGSLTNMDSMIIGIIVGVVAFVCILIIIICIIKLRSTQLHYHSSTMGIPGSLMQAPCTCLKPALGGGAPPPPPNMMPLPPLPHLCHCHPNFQPHPPHSGPLSAKMRALQNDSHHTSTLQRSDIYSKPPYYISYAEGENDYSQ